MKDNQIVTLTLFRFQTFAQKWWAFGQMGQAQKTFANIPGMEFSKMLGSGAGDGFSHFPNFSVYSLLFTWKNESAAMEFFNHHPIFQEFKNHSVEFFTLFMETCTVHGLWDGKTPFTTTTKENEINPVAVITRARIYNKSLLRFWQFVKPVSQSIRFTQDNLLAIGIGELPLIQQATFSLWKNGKAMKDYAYKSSFHKKVVALTRKENWYKEELFARFHPFKSVGSWGNLKLINE